MDRKELMIKCDMLDGNVARMMLTDNIRELYKNYVYAITCVNTIFTENEKRLTKEE